MEYINISTTSIIVEICKYRMILWFKIEITNLLTSDLFSLGLGKFIFVVV